MVEQSDQWTRLSEGLLQVVAALHPRTRRADFDVSEHAGEFRLAVERAEVVVAARYRWRPPHERTDIAEMVVTLLITTDNLWRAAGNDAAGVYVANVCNAAVELLGFDRAQSYESEFLGQLSEADYNLIAARFSDDQTIRELAAVFDVTYSRAAQRLFRILKLLRDHLQDRDADG